VNIAIIFATPVLLAALGLLIVKLRRLSWREDVGFRLPEPRRAALWALGFLALAVAAELVSSAAGLDDAGGSWKGKYDPANLTVRIAAIGLLYPLAEEFFFRGALLGFLAKRFGAAAGVIVSSAAFAAIHVQYDWRGMLFVLADALFFSICRLRTGSLYLVMAFHICGNGYAVWERIFG
jgi:hypothetical protein